MRIESGKLMTVFRGIKRCELCGGSYVLQTHHEPTWGSAGLETRLTLIRVCLECHSARHADDQEGMRALIVERICRREKCSAEDREAVVLLLKRAPKDASERWFFLESVAWPESATVLLVKTLAEAGVTTEE